MNFSERFLELRKQSGYSQEEIGYKLNVARQTISKWESGVTTPDMENLIKISQLFNISIDDLAGNKLENKSLEEKTSEIEKVENIGQIEEKEKPQKSKLRKFLKIIAIILVLAIIIAGIFVCKVVYNRYNLLTRVYLNFSNFHYNDMKYFDYTSYYNVIENSKTKESISIEAYKKDDKMKIMYFKENLGSMEKLKLPELVKIEFWDGDTYYDIDVINKTYAHERYLVDKDFNYSSTVSEMEYKLDYKLNLSSGWSRLFFACNYFYDIYLREINKEQDIIIEPRYIQNYKDMIQVNASYLCNSEPSLNFMLDTYKDNQHISETCEWRPVEEKYATDWQVELPDLTEYTLIEK